MSREHDPSVHTRPALLVTMADPTVPPHLCFKLLPNRPLVVTGGGRLGIVRPGGVEATALKSDYSDGSELTELQARSLDDEMAVARSRPQATSAPATILMGGTKTSSSFCCVRSSTKAPLPSSGRNKG